MLNDRYNSILSLQSSAAAAEAVNDYTHNMEGESSPHSSLCVVRAEELFPKLPLEKDDETLTVPLTERKCIHLQYSASTAMYIQ